MFHNVKNAFMVAHLKEQEALALTAKGEDPLPLRLEAYEIYANIANSNLPDRVKADAAYKCWNLVVYAGVPLQATVEGTPAVRAQKFLEFAAYYGNTQAKEELASRDQNLQLQNSGYDMLRDGLWK